MSRVRTGRSLDAEERRLWAHVARQAKPLKGRSLPELPPDAPAPDEAAVTGAASGAVSWSARPATRKVSAPPPLAPLERRLKTKLRRGQRGVDAVLDLHGLRQDEAHGTLLAFLRRMQGAGASLVLVVTGKGAAGSGDLGQSSAHAERGVLRRVVPHWLRLPELRPLVLGFEEAAAPHGGGGALYVRLRRPRHDTLR